MSGLTKLSDQIAFHEEWRTELVSTRRGSSTPVERRLDAWDRRDALEPDLWAYLVDWARRTGRRK